MVRNLIREKPVPRLSNKIRRENELMKWTLILGPGVKLENGRSV